MGIAAADFDDDGDQDLLMTHNVQETNTLYLNNGSGSFLDSTNRFGLAHSSLPFTGFGVAWADFDQRRGLDLFIANGAVAIMDEQRGTAFPFKQGNQYYRGSARGFELLDTASVWGSVVPGVSRGLATGDIDLDGDLDVVVANCNGPARLYLNQSRSERWIRIRLAGPSGNSVGIGALVGLCFEDGDCSWRRVHRDGSYLSSSEPVAHFGLESIRRPQHVKVRWGPSRREQFNPPDIGAVTTLRYGSGDEITR